MIAVILSGGLSSRMGQDKGLMKQKGEPWIQAIYNQLAYLQIPVYTSVNESQVDIYEEVLSKDQMIVDDPSIETNGPLRGILSAHQAFPKEDILFLPCDMPLLDAEVFDQWIHAFGQLSSSQEIVASKTEDQLQPLCGIYSSTGLSRLNNFYKNSELQNVSMHAVVEKYLPSFIFKVPVALLPKFKNFNTPQDLL